MPSRQAAVLSVLFLILLAALGLWLFRSDTAVTPIAPADLVAQRDKATAQDGELARGAGAVAGEAEEAARQQVSVGRGETGVRGVVVDTKTGQPLGGVEVIAVKEQPSFEPLVARFRGLFQQGLFVETRAPRRELGRTVSNADGKFELRGLPPGLVFLDGRSDGWFVRTPATARVATGEMVDGIELRAAPGGRVRGVVLGADGGPVAGAAVSVRPGLNAFFGQITERQYRWLETTTDDQGRFDLPGVPAGNGYTVAASAPQLALEEMHGIDVRVAQTTDVTMRAHLGATVAGVVVDARGAPVVNANVAMVYLDISRVLFSADGRSEPIVSDEQGRFRFEHVSAGRVAFVAVAPELAPSQIAELAVVDGGAYEDLELVVGEGATVRGIVVDDQQQPVSGATVAISPWERPDDPQFMKMMLKIRRVEVTSGADGRFEAKGLTGDRLVVQAQKTGYTTAMKFGVKLDEPEVVVEVQRGAVVRGKVMVGEQPLTRFRVDTRTRAIPAPQPDQAQGEVAGAEASAGGRNRRQRTDDGDDRNDDNPWAGGGRGGRGMREGTTQLPEGQTMMDRGLDGNWREIAAADGTFELRGIPPGRIRVRVRADGFLDAESQEVDLLPGQIGAELVFQIAAGETVAGVVVDDGTGQPVSDAQVTAYRDRGGDEGRRRGPFQVNIDPEDFDFLGLSSATNRRSAISDSKGQFEVSSLAPGKYRFTARHPDMAKASTKDVEIVAGQPVPPLEIRLDAGGGVEGTITGYGMRALPDALMVAFSIQTGTMRSSTSDKAGFYRIDGLPPGQYIVFKSRLDERADNIPLELMSNMRLKTATVRQGKMTRLDVHDVGEDGVRVYGIVRESGKPVPRALVTLLGNDSEGLLGMGVRANAAKMDGRYELDGIKPGSYVMQVSRFQGTPVQTTFEIEVPDEVRDFAFDIDLPTSEIVGRVIDTRGNAVANVPVTLGSDDSSLGGSGGLVGLIAQNGLSQGRTNREGEFRLRSVAPGTYRLSANSRVGGGPRRRGGGSDAEQVQRGEGSIEGLQVDGVTTLEGLVITLPIAGRIKGLVLDGSGQPVANAEIAYVETTAKKQRKGGNPMLDLLGAQAQPIRSNAEGVFEITGLNPGKYDLRVESEAVEAGKAADIDVQEDAVADVTLRMVRGATLRVRATNVDKQQIPIGNISLLDGNGKTVVSRVSTLAIMKRLMASRDTVEDSGWYEFGSVPPDTYTAVLREAGKPEIRITRTIVDGQKYDWDIDVAAELEARDRQAK